jgi:hypothetical protein
MSKGNLRSLNNGEMVSVSAPMADTQSDARKAIDANPLTAAVAAKVVEAHDRLENLKRPAVSTEIAGIIGRLADLDARHDNIGRGFDAVLTGLIYFCADEKRAQELMALKMFLLPDGLKIIARSYLEEAGQLRNLKSTLSATHAALLKAIQADSTTLFARFEEWCDIGEQMRTLDLKKAELQGTQPTGPTRADNMAARNAWIAAMNGLLAMADLAELPDATRQTIFGQLDALLERTSDRGSKPAEKPAPAAPPAPAPDPSSGGVE